MWKLKDKDKLKKKISPIYAIKEAVVRRHKKHTLNLVTSFTHKMRHLRHNLVL